MNENKTIIKKNIPKQAYWPEAYSTGLASDITLESRHFGQTRSIQLNDHAGQLNDHAGGFLGSTFFRGINAEPSQQAILDKYADYDVYDKDGKLVAKAIAVADGFEHGADDFENNQIAAAAQKIAELFAAYMAANVDRIKATIKSDDRDVYNDIAYNDIIKNIVLQIAEQTKTDPQTACAACCLIMKVGEEYYVASANVGDQLPCIIDIQQQTLRSLVPAKSQMGPHGGNAQPLPFPSNRSNNLQEFDRDLNKTLSIGFEKIQNPKNTEIFIATDGVTEAMNLTATEHDDYVSSELSEEIGSSIYRTFLDASDEPMHAVDITTAETLKKVAQHSVNSANQTRQFYHDIYSKLFELEDAISLDELLEVEEFDDRKKQFIRESDKSYNERKKAELRVRGKLPEGFPTLKQNILEYLRQVKAGDDCCVYGFHVGKYFESARLSEELKERDDVSVQQSNYCVLENYIADEKFQLNANLTLIHNSLELEQVKQTANLPICTVAQKFTAKNFVCNEEDVEFNPAQAKTNLQLGTSSLFTAFTIDSLNDLKLICALFTEMRNNTDEKVNMHNNPRWDKFWGKDNTQSWRGTWGNIQRCVLSRLVNFVEDDESENKQDSKAMLEYAKTQPLFNAWIRNVFRAGRTEAVREIDHMLDNLPQGPAPGLNSGSE